MLLFVLLAVFIGGLMVGRTPEYLGKKIQAREIKLVSLGALFTPLAVLMAAGAAATQPGYGCRRLGRRPDRASPRTSTPTSPRPTTTARRGRATPATTSPHPGNIGAHGITFADLLGGVTMVSARYAPILFVLAVAGASPARRSRPPASARCAPTPRPSSSS